MLTIKCCFARVCGSKRPKNRVFGHNSSHIAWRARQRLASAREWFSKSRVKNKSVSLHNFNLCKGPFSARRNFARRFLGAFWPLLWSLDFNIIFLVSGFPGFRSTLLGGNAQIDVFLYENAMWTVTMWTVTKLTYLCARARFSLPPWGTSGSQAGLVSYYPEYSVELKLLVNI